MDLHCESTLHLESIASDSNVVCRSLSVNRHLDAKSVDCLVWRYPASRGEKSRFVPGSDRDLEGSSRILLGTHERVVDHVSLPPCPRACCSGFLLISKQLESLGDNGTIESADPRCSRVSLIVDSVSQTTIWGSAEHFGRLRLGRRNDGRVAFDLRSIVNLLYSYYDGVYFCSPTSYFTPVISD